MGIDEYSILKKKQKKNAFAATALLISIAIALLVMVGAVLVLGKVNDNDRVTSSDNAVVENTTTSKDETTCEGLVKEIVFNDNLRNIKEAAISYFTNERLPQTIGDTEKITLEEMQNKKLLLNVRDSSGTTCDGKKSYVEVTKEENEYIMKIYLSCSNMEDYIIVHLGCYDYCDKDVCEKKVEKEYEYEYRKTTSCVMSPWSKWGDWKLTREKTSNLKKEDTKVETSQKETVSKLDAIANVSYNCDKYDGYTLAGETCVKASTITDTKDATKDKETYNCNNYPGYTLKGKECVKDITITDTKDADKDPDTYNCDKYPGYTKDGKICYKTTTDKKDAEKTYNCDKYKDKGYNLSGTKCIKKTTKTVDAEAVYSTKKVTKSYTCYQEKCTTKTIFSCPTSNTCGDQEVTTCEPVKKTCTKQVTEKYISDYKCPDSTYTKSKNKDGKYICTKTTTDTKDATLVYSCAKYSGYTKDGAICYKTTTDKKDAEKNPDTYNCNKYAGYTKVGKTCVKEIPSVDKKDATKNPDTYNCNSYPGYELNGTKCVKVTSSSDRKEATKNVTYTCPKGYDKDDKTCIMKTTETIKTIYYRYATRTCDGGRTSTKWSTSKNDSILKSEGYKLTGNKRELVEVIK